MENLQPGQMLGSYRIMNQVGQGGMATVYRAFQASMNRYVALKVLPKQLAENPEFEGRFLQEARIIANLEHPHILPVYDFGESNGISYLVMRYLDAGTLKDHMLKGSLSLAVIDRWFSQLADALEYAHAHGVIHRDLKPSNVLLDPRDNLFLTDFGIAKLLESSSKFTSTGAMIGTPDYMSPEQAQGLPVDQRTDIYSLGIILYEMVTGRVPFEAETPLAVILKHISAPLPLPSLLKPGLSPAIEQVLLKVLAKDPEDRFGSVEEFYAAWKQALEEKVSPAPAWPSTGLPTIIADEAARMPAAMRPETTSPHPLLDEQRKTAALNAPTLVEPAAGGKKKLPGWAIAGVVLGVLLLIFFIFVSIAPTIRDRIAARRANRQATPPAAQVAAATNIPSETEKPQLVQQPAQPPAQPRKWTSWVAANHPWLMLVDEDRVIGGGVGVSIWSKDGTLLKRFNGPLDRLPDVFVTALLVDPERVLWVGTGDGVARYDGTQWQVFNMDDGLDSNSIGALAQGKDGIIVGTQFCAVNGCGLGVLSKNGYDPVKGFPSIEGGEEDGGKLSNEISALLPVEGTLWVGTWNGLAHFDGQTWKTYFVSDGLPGQHVNSIYAARNGIIWVATSSGAAIFDGNRFTPVERLKDTNILDIQEDKDGHYWFSTDGGIIRYDPATSDWQRYTQDDGLLSYTYYAIDVDKDGILYIGSDNGLTRFDGKEFTTWILPNVPNYQGISRILPSNDPGKLWMISPDSAANPDILDVRSETWSVEMRLPEGCAPLAVGAEGSIWCGGEAGMWIVRRDGTFTRYTTQEGLPSDRIIALMTLPDGSAWVGTADQGVARFDGKGFPETFNVKNAGLSSNEITALLSASDGSLWVGSPLGLDRRLPDGKWEHYRAGSPFGSGAEGITDIAQDISGKMWVSTWGEGGVVYTFFDGKWERISADDPMVGLPNDVVKCITAAPDGSLWFGSYYHGVAHWAAPFDGKSWQQFQVRDGLVYSDVNDIFVDTAGTVWIATTGGVSRFIP